MVRVDQRTSDRIVAWRVRDALAAHPLLGGATAEVHIIATFDRVLLTGWTLDAAICALAVQIAQRTAGRRSVLSSLQSQRTVKQMHPQPANKTQTDRLFDNNNPHTLS